MASIRALVRVYLMEFGFEFQEATNGRDGLAAALSNPPDLIILDLQMPVLDGAGFLLELRNLPRIASTPVIVLSADERVPPQAASGVGARTYVTRKPITPTALKQVVREALHLP